MSSFTTIRVKWNVLDVVIDLSRKGQCRQKGFSVETRGEVGSWLAHWSKKPSQGTNGLVTVCAQSSM